MGLSNQLYCETAGAWKFNVIICECIRDEVLVIGCAK
jgi:hypothetical protein